MKLRLTGGAVVVAVKDCECVTHEGPHWIHMDALWHERNRELLKKGSYLALLGFTKEEAARLKQKQHDMASYHVSEIL